MPAKRARRPRPGTARLVGGRAVRVLIAEDNAANRKVLLRQLEKLGYTADAVTSGTEVLAALQAVPYDVILMDCQMPDMDGYETTARIRALEGPISRTPIVAVTAFALRSDREKCLHAGMDDYLSKPVDEQELAAALARWTVDGAAARPPGTSDVIDAQTLAYLRSLRRDGEDEYLPNIINQFLEDTTRRLEELDRARASDDRERVIQLAHSLKGGAALLGANRLARLCGELEANGITLKAEALGEAIRGLAAALEQVRHAVGVTHPSAGETPPTTEGSE